MKPYDFEQTTLLVRATKGGDLAAREALFGRYIPLVTQSVSLLMGTRLSAWTEADDLAQESLTDAFLALRSFEHRTEGSFRYWMVSIVHNNVRDAARDLSAQKRDPSRLSGDSTVLVENVYDSLAESPLDQAAARELGRRIEDGLLKLSAKERAVIVYHKLCGLSFREIAKVMHAPESSLRRMSSRAIARLGTYL